MPEGHDPEAVAAQLECSTLMLLTNELGEGGVVTNSYDEIPDEKKYANVQIGLEKTLQVIPPDISLVLEPLNTRLDHPGYYLTEMEKAGFHDLRAQRFRLRVLALSPENSGEPASHPPSIQAVRTLGLVNPPHRVSHELFCRFQIPM